MAVANANQDSESIPKETASPHSQAALSTTTTDPANNARLPSTNSPKENAPLLDAPSIAAMDAKNVTLPLDLS